MKTAYIEIGVANLQIIACDKCHIINIGKVIDFTFKKYPISYDQNNGSYHCIKCGDEAIQEYQSIKYSQNPHFFQWALKEAEYKESEEIATLKDKLARRNTQITDLRGQAKKEKGYSAEKLLKGLAGYCKWADEKNISSETILFNIVHDLYNWLKERNEKWFSPRTADYEKYIK